MKIEVFEYNSFCSDTFLGNPAGVCMDVVLSKEEKQNVAYTNGFSETAFLLEEDSCFKISFFTPTSEIDLCCLLYTSPSPRDRQKSRMPSSA